MANVRWSSIVSCVVLLALSGLCQHADDAAAAAVATNRQGRLTEEEARGQLAVSVLTKLFTTYTLTFVTTSTATSTTSTTTYYTTVTCTVSTQYVCRRRRLDYAAEDTDEPTDGETRAEGVAIEPSAVSSELKATVAPAVVIEEPRSRRSASASAQLYVDYWGGGGGGGGGNYEPYYPQIPYYRSNPLVRGSQSIQGRNSNSAYAFDYDGVETAASIPEARFKVAITTSTVTTTLATYLYTVSATSTSSVTTSCISIASIGISYC
jgi:hypothetical protein